MPQSGYRLSTGTVQTMLVCESPFCCFHFGAAQYDRNKPILTDSIRSQAQPIVDELNAGDITLDEAKDRLEKIWI